MKADHNRKDNLKKPIYQSHREDNINRRRFLVRLAHVQLLYFAPIRRRLRAITNHDSEHGRKQTELPGKTGEDRNVKE
jgi:hypothetical protein